VLRLIFIIFFNDQSQVSYGEVLGDKISLFIRVTVTS